MNSSEKIAAKKVAGLMRASRKRLSWTQTYVSKAISISQSALSKMESGLLIPSASQWYEFCVMAGISTEALSTGIMEFNKKIVLESGPLKNDFKIAKRYLDHRGSKVRSTQPFLDYFKTVYSSEKLNEYLSFIGVDPDYFIDFDAQLNLNFYLDMTKHLVTQGKLKGRDFPKLVKSVPSRTAQGRFHDQYMKSQSCALKLLFENVKFYECNFQYRIEEERAQKLVVSVKPEKHLREFKYRDDAVLGKFLCEYKQGYFEQFTEGYDTEKRGKISIRELDCHYSHKHPDRCVYELKLVA